MTTSGYTILQLAKQGDPKAIAVLLNRHLNQQKVVTKVVSKEDCLKILVEADQLPQEEAICSFIEKGISRLNPTGITTINVYGKINSEEKPSWQRKIALSSLIVSSEDIKSSPNFPARANDENQLTKNVSISDSSAQNISVKSHSLKKNDTKSLDSARSNIQDTIHHIKNFTQNYLAQEKIKKILKTSHIFATIPLTLIFVIVFFGILLPTEKSAFKKKLNYYLSSSNDPQINRKEKTIFREIFGYEVAYEQGQKYCRLRSEGVTEDEIRSQSVAATLNLMYERDITPEEAVTLSSIGMSIKLAAVSIICPEFQPSKNRLSLEERLFGN